jgi:hypothetical protein
MTKETDIIQRLEVIETRNTNVTLDKAWETSLTRKVAIATLTYVVVVVYLHMIHNDNPWINAIVPPTGFLLSTLALGWLRSSWQRRNS